MYRVRPIILDRSAVLTKMIRSDKEYGSPCMQSDKLFKFSLQEPRACLQNVIYARKKSNNKKSIFV